TATARQPIFRSFVLSSPVARVPSPHITGDLGCISERELDAAAHRIDAFGADAYAVAVLPNELLRLCAAASPSSALALVAAWHGDDGMIAFAIHAARACRFLQRIDRQQSL